MKKALLIIGFLPATGVTLLLSFILLIKLPQINAAGDLLRQQARMITHLPADYTVASFIPQVLGSFTEAITSGDARPIIIRNYLRQYKSPLLPYADIFVTKADKYGLKQYLLPIAIAQQESNLGKKVPPNCHNAWGWGIHSRGRLCFPNWETAIDAYIHGLTEQYRDILKIEDENKMLQALMARYAPVSMEKSDGSWAKGVRQFLDEIAQPPETASK